MVVKFTNEQIRQYSQASIEGAEYLAYRDIVPFCNEHHVDTRSVLDLGCGGGRSIQLLKQFCVQVSGCDIAEEALRICRTILPDTYVFMNSASDQYPGAPYSAIFSFQTFFHFSSIVEISTELSKCYASLTSGGSLIIVNGTRHLFTRQLALLETISPPPKNDGDVVYQYLVSMGVKVKDYFWDEATLIKRAEACGFHFCGAHHPLGGVEDGQNYIDEYQYPPYFYLAFKK